ncbi:TIP120-domain-containing protein [Nadsonia fulvescens var. elongata DSM 6958]|uniref:TIP120-domain-containing protein n=1 Tax=Nadsonia fulvescens var. elongata DSM 6958 TaxID=857566 RepID=A0A1E3PFZ4_9ASCO|nr:TIP120-domain-containing protein [Nadsonia fulvescens var. elongata DSM 6958]
MSRVNQIQQLVSQTNDLDSDIRFMALNDLNNLLSDSERASGFNHDNQSIVQIIQALLKLLKDPISEVKNQAIKCFVPLVHYASDSHIQFIITKIRETTVAHTNNSSSNDEQDQSDESIRFAALRSVITNVPARSSIARLIAEELLPYQLKVPIMTESLDAVDIVMEIIKRFGSIFNENEINKVLKNLLETLSRSKKNVIKKRTTTALGLLARYLKGPELYPLMNYITESLSAPGASDDQLKHTILLTSIIARNEPSKFVPYFNSIYPLIHRAMKLDSLDADDNSERVELREAILIALESIVSVGYKVVEPVIQDIIDICAQFIKYDPNYIDSAENIDVYADTGVDFSNTSTNSGPIKDDDDFDFADNDFDDDDNENDEGFYSEFSDDEDLNWKLRRASARLVTTLTNKSPLQLVTIYSMLVPSLVLRAASEREESVRVEILNALDAVIRATDYSSVYYTAKSNIDNRSTRRNSDISMITDADPQNRLELVAARISLGAIVSLRDNKVSFPVKQAYLANVLTDLVRVLQGLSGAITEQLVQVVCEVSSSNNSLLPDALRFINTVLRFDATTDLTLMINTFSTTILEGINDSYYKVTISGIESSISLFDHLKGLSMSSSIPVHQFCASLCNKVQTTAFDSEVRQQALVALGSLVSSVPIDQDTSASISQIILTTLSNETLRVSAIKSIELIVNTESLYLLNDLEWVAAVISQLCVFLRQSSRVLRQACLSTLKLVAVKITNNNESQIPLSDLASSLLSAAVDLDDAQLQSLVLDILALLYTSIWHQDLAESQQILDYAVNLVYQENSKLVSKSLIALFESFTCANDPKQLYNQLISSKSNATDGIASEAIAIVVARGHLTDITDQHIAQIADSVDDQTTRGSLYILGSIGRLMPLTISLDTLFDKFMSSTESVRLAAARAIGGIASGNYRMYILTVLKHLTSSSSVADDAIDNERVYLNLVSAHEILLQILDSPEKAKEFLPYTHQLWDTLFFIETNDESSRDLTAECVGKLALAYPELFLPLLKKNLSSDSVTTRLVVISAIKYTLGQSQDQKYDGLLQPIVADFLSLVQDENVEIRQIAFSAIMSAVHHKSRLLLPQMSRLLPLLYQGTNIDPSLVKTVQMGPFKHKVDGGLDLRKTVYETMFTLVSTLEPAQFLQCIQPKEMTDRFINGGLDDDHDIKVLACVTLPRLVALDIEVLGGENIKILTAKFRAALTKTVKDNAIKQEFEKQAEIKRNISRCTIEMDQYIRGTTNGDTSSLSSSVISSREKGGLSDVEVGIWVEYYNEVRGKQLIDVVFE